jgi:preprotein translocase subunit SecF
MNFVGSRKIFYSVSGVLVALSILSMLLFGLNLGSDFTGDATLDGNYITSRPNLEELRSSLEGDGIELDILEARDDKGLYIRTKFLSEDDHQRLLGLLNESGQFEEASFVSRGPVIGRQLRQNAVKAISIALVVIVLFVAWSFRKVSRPVSSWMYGLVAIVALAHDIIIPAGVFSFLQIEIDSLFVSAVLTVLGFSVHDTIVVFDRIRESLRKAQGARKYSEIVESSLHETLTRSINTSLTTVAALAAIFFLGGPSTQYLVLALIIGILAGTYSSIFIASPLLVTIERWRSK